MPVRFALSDELQDQAEQGVPSAAEITKSARVMIRRFRRHHVPLEKSDVQPAEVVTADECEVTPEDISSAFENLPLVPVGGNLVNETVLAERQWVITQRISNMMTPSSSNQPA